jgi:hypothetical protein
MTAQRTARQLLLRPNEQMLPGLLPLLTKSRAIGVVASAAGLWPHGIATLATDVASAATGLLDIDIGHALLAGWSTYSALQSAARETAATPGRSQRVALASHQIAATYEPSLQITVNGRPASTFHFAIELAFTVDGWLAKVHTGRLVAVEFGRCRYSAKVSCEGTTLASTKGELEPTFTIRLGSGIPLAVPPARLASY